MTTCFPLFVDLSKKKILVVGAGRIASRRMEALLPFAGQITAIAPEAALAVHELARAGKIRYLPRPYIEGEIPRDTCLVLAATGDREVNRAVYRECKEKGIPVNVSSEKELCDFYFPGIIQEENLTVGVTAGGRDHALARRATEYLRQAVRNFSIEEKEAAGEERRSGSSEKEERKAKGKRQKACKNLRKKRIPLSGQGKETEYRKDEE